MRFSHAVVMVTTILLTCASRPRPSKAACGAIPEALILFDRSGSMQEPLGPSQTKWNVAVAAVTDLTKSFQSQMAFGLMFFPQDWSCGVGNVNVNPTVGNSASIASALQAQAPGGSTPIADALWVAHGYLMAHNSGKPQYVVLITDGMETCYGNPVADAAALLASGIKTYVVGFGSAVSAAALGALATAGGTGQYYQADSPIQLKQALASIAAKITCCGDGTLDPGEKCDTAIPGGLPGSCPTSCDDSNPCTADTLQGSDCTLACQYVNICVCGDGKLDPGEKCDPGLALGSKGACPGSCTSADPCLTATPIGSGCQLECLIEAKKSSPTVKDGCCPAGLSADEDGDCPDRCGPDVTENCISPCQGISCPAGNVCHNGQCVPNPTGTEQPQASNPAEDRPNDLGQPINGGCACDLTDRPSNPWTFGSTSLGLLGLVGLVLWQRRAACARFKRRKDRRSGRLR
jgi:MYXO-CTERM domain-containing protein